MSNGDNGVMSNGYVFGASNPPPPPPKKGGGGTKGNRTIVISLNCPKELTMYCVCVPHCQHENCPTSYRAKQKGE